MPLGETKAGIYMTLNQAFAKRLDDLLTKHQKSKYRLEKDTGLSHSALRHIFNHNNKDIRLSSVAKVASFFNMTLSEFFAIGFDLSQIDFE